MQEIKKNKDKPLQACYQLSEAALRRSTALIPSIICVILLCPGEYIHIKVLDGYMHQFCSNLQQHFFYMETGIRFT